MVKDGDLQLWGIGNLKVLNLAGECVYKRASVYVSGWVSVDCPAIGPDGVRPLAEAWKAGAGANLTRLDLSRNDLGPVELWSC